MTDRKVWWLLWVCCALAAFLAALLIWSALATWG